MMLLVTAVPVCVTACSCAELLRMKHFRTVIKIAFIGAGSIEFTRNVATDLCTFAEFSGQLHLSLHDISADRLGFAERLVRRIAEQTGAQVLITASADRAEAISGARYVINEVQVG